MTLSFVKRLSPHWQQLLLLVILNCLFSNGVFAQKPPKRNYPGQFFTSVEKLPEFPGGQIAMLRFLADHIQFPNALDKINYKPGPIKVRFIVAPDGSLYDITVDSQPVVIPEAEKGMDDYLISIIRAVEKMPRWTPARMGEQPVAMLYTIPLKVDN
jgi:protein TonB